MGVFDNLFTVDEMNDAFAFLIKNAKNWKLVPVRRLTIKLCSGKRNKRRKIVLRKSLKLNNRVEVKPQSKSQKYQTGRITRIRKDRKLYVKLDGAIGTVTCDPKFVRNTNSIHMDDSSSEEEPASGPPAAGSPTGQEESDSSPMCSFGSADYSICTMIDGSFPDLPKMTREYSLGVPVGVIDRDTALMSADNAEPWVLASLKARESMDTIQGDQNLLVDGFKKSDTRRRLADLEAPHGLFIFAPILMLLMLIYLILRKPAAKWNSTSSSRSDHSATTEKSSAKYQ